MLSKRQAKNIIWLLEGCLEEGWNANHSIKGFYTHYGFKTYEGLVESIRNIIKEKAQYKSNL